MYPYKISGVPREELSTGLEINSWMKPLSLSAVMINSTLYSLTGKEKEGWWQGIFLLYATGTTALEKTTTRQNFERKELYTMLHPKIEESHQMYYKRNSAVKRWMMNRIKLTASHSNHGKKISIIWWQLVVWPTNLLIHLMTEINSTQF